MRRSNFFLPGFILLALLNGSAAYFSPWDGLWLALAAGSLALAAFLASAKKTPLLKAGPGNRILIPEKYWIGFFLAGSFLRFYKLTDFRPWPTGDEALQLYYAIDLQKQWSWNFFYSSGQHPPLFIWLTAGVLSVFHHPLFALWFVPAAASVLTLALGYWAADFWVGRQNRLIFLILLSLSFWPLLIGRYGLHASLLPLFEMGCFYGFQRFDQAKAKTKNYWALGLGLLVGLGTFTFTSWLAVIPGFALFFWAQSAKTSKGSRPWFFLGLLAGAAPWLSAFFAQKVGGYWLGVSVLSGFFSWRQQLATAFSNFTVLLWGPFHAQTAYGPFWGGFLNPVLGAFFGLGFFILLKDKLWPRGRWTIGLLFFFLLPGVLSADHVEMMRILPAMPLVLMVCVWGIRVFMGRVPAFFGKAALLVLGLLSLGLDLNHLSFLSSPGPKAFLPGAPPAPQDENFRAYQILQAEARKNGPGIIYTDFLLLSHGHSLAACTYPFNAAENISLDNGEAKWAAVIANVNYGPFLAKRFPGLRWIPVGLDLSSDGGLAVGLIPLGPGDHYLFNQWLETHRYFHELNLQAEEILNRPDLYAQALKDLPEGEKWMGKDPFLESLFGEWKAQYHYGAGGYQANEDLLRQTIQKGYPAAQLYFKLGNFLWLEGQKAAAKEAYAKAAQQEPRLTQASQALALLQDGK